MTPIDELNDFVPIPEDDDEKIWQALGCAIFTFWGLMILVAVAHKLGFDHNPVINCIRNILIHLFLMS